MTTILITGAASGIGLAFLRHYAASSHNHRIIAIDREPISSLSSEPTKSQITRHQVDLTSESSITSLASQLNTTPVDLVIHSAGIRGLVPSVEAAYPNNVAACETLAVMDKATLMRTFEINTVGTFLLIQAFLPSLLLSAAPKVVVMASRMGSLAANTAGSAYAYRASKAALNAVVKSFSIDVPEVVFVLVHPGRVESRLVRCKEEGAIEAEESVEEMLDNVIGKLGKEWSGRYVDRWGNAIAW
ncbi:hypothetical protein W97_01659 [Coniosporium apollinis CBS 100218]|uniref:NAD(P)-binding protein n=1 Tax=Coniosporium apollinis (strain CBS 100218) TaxID=1168221 RepID=R7YKI7_CONA1|nr:uncharacterized protein W97_01659 [Coniosporium apollinis CBS 100218]EON62437.1 hypothetical protein W97_01659 [Coniosporium apollinis CBS 100218]